MTALTTATSASPEVSTVEPVVTPQLTRIDGLTGLRFWFAMLVVCHHSLMHWFGSGIYPIADFGYIGVDFFFVLSGFVLSWPSRSLRTGRFYWDRVSRIWPLHLLGAAAALLLLGVPGILTIVANVFLVQAWFPHASTYMSLDSVSWSLSVEAFFYLQFPWLLPRLRQLGSTARWWVAAGVVGAMLVYPGLFSLTIAPTAPGPHEWTTYVLPAWRLGEFTLGAIVALEVRRGWRPGISGPAAMWLLVACSAGLLGYGMHLGHLPNRPLIEITGAVLAALMFAAVAADEVDGRRLWLARRWMVLLGASSYALYLCHALLMDKLLGVSSFTGTGAANVVGWIGYVLLAVGLSIALHRGVELPCERWLRGHRPRRAR